MKTLKMIDYSVDVASGSYGLANIQTILGIILLVLSIISILSISVDLKSLYIPKK